MPRSTERGMNLKWYCLISSCKRLAYPYIGSNVICFARKYGCRHDMLSDDISGITEIRVRSGIFGQSTLRYFYFYRTWRFFA